jgi:hypothetical protein
MHNKFVFISLLSYFIISSQEEPGHSRGRGRGGGRGGGGGGWREKKDKEEEEERGGGRKKEEGKEGRRRGRRGRRSFFYEIHLQRNFLVIKVKHNTLVIMYCIQYYVT